MQGSCLQLFADDTAVFKSGKDLIAVNDCLNKELSNLMNWTYANRLSLNMEKTISVLTCASACPLFLILKVTLQVLIRIPMYFLWGNLKGFLLGI